MGYRILLDGKTVAYCPDTGYCENAVDLARQADVLIAECAYKTGQDDAEWPHLNPETAARIAIEGEAGQLVLTHFDAQLYRSIAERRDSAVIAGRTFRNTIAATDGLVLEL
jgi:ribonuclease BN (tRNA processing enzyme)